MHIAICDDNVADRKQLERLLKRESDKRASKSGVLYIDSYGHPDSLLANPMQYDAFFVDICKTEGFTGRQVVDSLSALGCTAPVIMCCSEVDYRRESFPERVLFIDKPIRTLELSAVLDSAQTIKDSAVPVIELRQDSGTLYVTEPDILYAVAEKRHLNVALADGRNIAVTTTASNFFSQVENFPVFFAPDRHTVINGRHIQAFRLHKITMCDGAVFKAFGRILSYAKQVHADTH